MRKSNWIASLSCSQRTTAVKRPQRPHISLAARNERSQMILQVWRRFILRHKHLSGHSHLFNQTAIFIHKLSPSSENVGLSSLKQIEIYDLLWLEQSSLHERHKTNACQPHTKLLASFIIWWLLSDLWADELRRKMWATSFFFRSFIEMEKRVWSSFSAISLQHE